MIEEAFRALQRQVQALQELHRGVNIRERDESEDEEQVLFEEEHEVVRDLDEARFLRFLSKIGQRPKIEVFKYSRNLNPEELIILINNMEEYFEYEGVGDLERVKFAKTKLKGHASIWWK